MWWPKSWLQLLGVTCVGRKLKGELVSVLSMPLTKHPWSSWLLILWQKMSSGQSCWELESWEMENPFFITFFPLYGWVSRIILNSVCANSSWLLQPIVSYLELPDQLALQATVNLFIQNSSWVILNVIQQNHPALVQHIREIVIPLEQKEDTMILDHSTNGRLNLKETYKHVSPSD